MIDSDSLQNLEKLHELKVAGIVSDDEFAQAKERILSGRGHDSPYSKPRTSIPEVGTFDAYLASALAPFRCYAEFSGRSSRKEFWLFFLLCNVAIAFLAVVAVADTDALEDTGPLGSLAFGLIAVGLLATIVPLLAIEVRRFHDQGRSGWMALLNLITYVGSLIVLVFMALPGTDEPNEYGSPPTE